MSHLKIGVMLESFRLPTHEAIEVAAKIGAQGIQMYTLKETHPDNLSSSERKELLRDIKSHKLTVSALCGDFGGFGLERAEDNPQKITLIKKAIDLAVDMETNVVTTHIGTIPGDSSAPVYQVLFSACSELAKYAEERGVTFAIETGPEDSNTLKQFLNQVNSKGIGVNFDPANLRMVVGEDAVQAAENLKEYVVHTHAKDGIQLKSIEPVKIYHCFAGDNPHNIDPDDYFKEVPLGKGQVNFEGYIRILRNAGYEGFYTIEREVGEQPLVDIKEAVHFLKNIQL